MKKSLSQKVFLELDLPGGADTIGDRDRIVRALIPQFNHIKFSMETLIKYYKVLRESNWQITVSLIWTGDYWELVRIEKGDTTQKHYGYAVDLGSTTVFMQLIDLNTGTILAEDSVFNNQIAFGEDILSRIFYAKGKEEHLQEIKKYTIDSIRTLMEKLEKNTGILSTDCDIMVLGGNTTMVHFLLGIDPWFIFHTPYTPTFNHFGFLRSELLDLPFNGLLYAFPSVANYLGGDVVSGILASDMTEKSEMALYIDIGTNGEMVLGNDRFLLTIAGAAGPALEGGISKHGMQAKPGAVDTVKIQNNEMILTTIENRKPVGICGSGIVDLIAEMLLEGWIDFGGRFNEGKSDRIVKREGDWAVAYAWEHESASGEELLFTETDIAMYLDTKAAANTMIEILLENSGVEASAVQRVYMAGAFGKYMNLESAITIGLYPDLPRDRFVRIGNGSLQGAYALLMNRELIEKVEEIYASMNYLQLEEAADFLTKMYAAKFLPHTNLNLYPTVKEKLLNRSNNKYSM
ncbi:uncharacterized 2Fe-2S/4Fe-4S cluster protein (DUF4445 family) [Alkalibaculum bacchi]|uniref:Uncharacterized 2Fe-2S/4Fe-4S cluster protein (DUF4445 family) n=1 Tax=Alkalibaculum bacchi TaxID=645887 RepID=A0A366I3N7_9FIRM|nr:ASKHA domain-containing protein [Alkalibaculum bacchi]RBP61388.1 uncharacterized 2Fe-2S/4Fe-4S cluster protein (DUF4445 family) [Alkalibaculum bacchi]